MVVEPLMEASLSGYNAHGIMRVPRYVREIQRGEIALNAPFTLLNETVSVAHVDAGNGLGAITATRSVELACRKAQTTGIGCVSTKNSNDIARLGSYVAEPARQGYLTLLAVNDSGGFPLTAPFGGVGRFFSTNPLAAGIPCGDQEPVVIDMSTSATSFGQITMAHNEGRDVPEGWIIDRNGKAVTSPQAFLEQPSETALLPLGGLLTGHKGFALQILVEVLAGALGGAGICNGTDPEFEKNAIFCLAIDPEHFVSRTTFVAMTQELVNGLKQSTPLPGVEEILLPGERATRERQQREVNGIPVDLKTVEELKTILTEVGLFERYATAFSDDTTP